MFVALGNAIAGLLLPPRCPLCQALLPADRQQAVCDQCRPALLPIGSPLCTVCGVPFEGAGDDHPCSRCCTCPPPYRAARAALKYTDACRRLIHGLKYRQQPAMRRPLGLLTAGLLADFVAAQQPELLVPVPLHPSRLRSRGFNQSILIAEILSRRWAVPLLRQGLRRTRPTTPQVELNRAERLTNLQHAFAVAGPVAGRRVMLVDDVFTTGSTLAACAEALLQAGCTEITAVTVAHVPYELPGPPPQTTADR